MEQNQSNYRIFQIYFEFPAEFEAKLFSKVQNDWWFPTNLQIIFFVHNVANFWWSQLKDELEHSTKVTENYDNFSHILKTLRNRFYHFQQQICQK